MTTPDPQPLGGHMRSQDSIRPIEGDTWVDPELVRRARELAARGSVLLRNDGALPLAPRARVALFGRSQLDWIAVGYGSGGDVNAPYRTNLTDSLRETGAVALDEQLAGTYAAWCAEQPADPGLLWGRWPMSYPEMELDDAAVAAAAARNDVAVIVIGRAAGEDRENVLEPGSYYLTDAEKRLLAQVTGAFERTVVVVDTGNVIDLGWVDEHTIDAVLLAWLGGMEGARAIADVLTGAVEPGGRLTDTIARRYEDCPSADHFGDPDANDYVEDVFVGYRYFETFAPDAVLFPFGHGLGYTTFDIDVTEVEWIQHRAGFGGTTVRAVVTNTGERSGSEVVQVYLAKPAGVLGAPSRELVGFARTRALAPGASESLEITVPRERFASYDDSGATGHRSAWMVASGEHAVFVGPDVRRARRAGGIEIAEPIVVEQLEAAAGPRTAFDRLIVERAADGTARPAYESVPQADHSLRERILDRLPSALEGSVTSDDEHPTSGPVFTEVVSGEATLDAFVASLAPSELASLAYGDIIMDSPLGPAGNAGVFGGVTEALRERGVPAAVATDGPSGIRLATWASLLPCGTALASAWDPEAVEQLAALHAEEMLRKGSDVLLSPGMNIHRDPLCGRNFEYFSEDPLVTGTTGAAVVRGIQSRGVSACPKHFAANNQETNRIFCDSRVSERALREIYLRGFEQVVKEAAPRTIMTSYNLVNGVWGHYHYDLVTTILRGQWGFDGLVLTDWWMRLAPDPDFPDLADSAYRVRAGVDVLMPGASEHYGTVRDDAIVESYARPEGITLGEIQRTARAVLQFLLEGGIAQRERHPQR